MDLTTSNARHRAVHGTASTLSVSAGRNGLLEILGSEDVEVGDSQDGGEGEDANEENADKWT